ncbi:MAG TPA: metallophosphoesterase family protein [Dehalococcoidia bacterium]|nr:metallophosphoesterase family protein [Dehalococcoidia bacterium]
MAESLRFFQHLWCLAIDLIIHAGDFTTMGVLNKLKQLGEVKTVQGNMDSAEIKNMLPIKDVIELDNRVLWHHHN